MLPAYRVLETRQHVFGKANVCSLVPIILQAYVAEVREESGSAIPVKTKLPIHPCACVRHRTWSGCNHALMLRSGEDAVSVRIFIEDG